MKSFTKVLEAGQVCQICHLRREQNEYYYGKGTYTGYFQVDDEGHTVAYEFVLTEERGFMTGFFPIDSIFLPDD